MYFCQYTCRKAKSPESALNATIHLIKIAIARLLMHTSTKIPFHKGFTRIIGTVLIRPEVDDGFWKDF